MDAMAGGAYGGYLEGIVDTWVMKFSTFNPEQGWLKSPFADPIKDMYPHYRDMLNKTDDSVALAFGKILRVCIMHRVTDIYGPIPYSKMMDNDNSVYKLTPFGNISVIQIFQFAESLGRQVFIFFQYFIRFFQFLNAYLISADLVSIMKGYEDPRLDKMFVKGVQTVDQDGEKVDVYDYYGVRIGIFTQKKDDMINLNLS